MRPGETMTIRPLAAFILMAVVGFFLAQLHAQNQEKFKARLSTIAMDGGMRETVAGRRRQRVFIAAWRWACAEQRSTI